MEQLFPLLSMGSHQWVHVNHVVPERMKTWSHKLERQQKERKPTRPVNLLHLGYLPSLLGDKRFFSYNRKSIDSEFYSDFFG